MNKIILFGSFGSGNIGNDTSLEAALHNVRKYKPDANVICVCNGPSEVSRRFGIQTVPMSAHEADKRTSDGLPSRIIRLLVRLKDEVFFWLQRPRWFRPGDKFIVAGSGGADDFGVLRPWHRPYVLYKWCKVAKMGGAQVIFLSTGAGPILNRISKFLMLKALRMADYRSYRDDAAFNYLHSVGYDTSGDRSYPDLVFSLPKASLPTPKISSSTPPVVGLGLINYYGHRYEPGIGERIYQEYLSKIKRFASWLLSKGYIIRVLSGDIADRSPAKDLVEFVNKEGEAHWQEKLIVPEIRDANELFNQVAQTDLVIASRFHNVLCALLLERPVISLSYHEKNDFLMKEMGLGHYCQHIEHFTTERLTEQFSSCIQENDRIVRQIHDQLDSYRNLLDEQYKMLLS
ncbi:MAG: polysaccharide pyruvyl transferase family protein [Anaerolineales bacterium]